MDFSCSELVNLRWEQIDLKAGLLHVARIKNGVASTHPIRGLELRALRELRRQYLGHKNIRHTVRYTELSPERFKGFWKD